MNQSSRVALQEALRAATTNYVIEYNGRPVGKVFKAFERARDRAGIEDFTPHDLRHTAAVWMAENGVPFEKIAQLLGNTLAITYRVYARFSPGYLADAVGSLEVGGSLRTQGEVS